jgi:hypothetical protein
LYKGNDSLEGLYCFHTETVLFLRVPSQERSLSL